MRDRLAAVVAAGIAVLAWGALGLQLVLIVQANIDAGRSGWLGAWRFIGFFTILTNLLVAIVCSAALMPRRWRPWLSSPGVRAGTAVYIAVVGLVYSLLLRALWNPEGLQKLADVVLHDVIPPAYFLYWLFLVRTGSLRMRIVLTWLLYPLAYAAYALVRGAFDGWYPYPFLDVGKLGYARVLINVAALAGAFSVLSVVLVGIDRRWSQWTPR